MLRASLASLAVAAAVEFPSLPLSVAADGTWPKSVADGLHFGDLRAVLDVAEAGAVDAQGVLLQFISGDT